MTEIISACLGAGFFLSETSLAIWRRASPNGKTKSRDGGSLRLLWIVISLSITTGALLAVNGVPPRLPLAVPWPLLGIVVFGVGAVLRWWSIAHLGRFFTVDVAVADDHRIVDTGPYKFIRHPSYTGLILQLAGLGLAFSTLPALVMLLVPTTLALLYRVRVEEAALHAHLPGAYADYVARTKKIVPLLY